MTMRLFIALHLGSDIRERLSRMQAALRKADAEGAIRWVNPDSMHLTLRFLGETPEFAVPGLISGLGASLAGQRAIRLGLAGIGGFPNLRQPRVIWVGLVGDFEALHGLQQRVETAVTVSGWPSESRPFQPHLTLGRAGDPKRPLAPNLSRAIASAKLDSEMQPHRNVALVRSHLGPRGSRYEDVADWSLEA